MNKGQQFTLDFEHRASFSGEDFLVTPANEAAIGWLDHWPNWPHSALAISGPSGSGKTHLSHVFISRTDAQAVNLGLLETTNIRPLVSSSKTFVLDDIDLMIDSNREEILFHFLNVIKEKSRSMILFSSLPPARWSVKLPDLQSRLNSIPHVSISPPDDKLLKALVIKLFKDRQLEIDSAIVDYIFTRSERSFEGIRTIIAKIDETALQKHRNITIPLIRSVLD